MYAVSLTRGCVKLTVLTPSLATSSAMLRCWVQKFYVQGSVEERIMEVVRSR